MSRASISSEFSLPNSEEMEALPIWQPTLKINFRLVQNAGLLFLFHLFFQRYHGLIPLNVTLPNVEQHGGMTGDEHDGKAKCHPRNIVPGQAYNVGSLGLDIPCVQDNDSAGYHSAFLYIPH